MLVKDIMSSQLITIASNASLKECAQRMDRFNIGALPVTEDGRMVGFITDRDICCRAVGVGKDTAKTPVKDIMTRHVDFCFDDQSCSEAADIMKSQRRRRLPIVGRDQRMIGIISVEDIARYSHEMAGKLLDQSSPICAES